MNIDIEVIEAKLLSVKLNTEGSQDNPTSRSDLNFECLAAGKLANTLVGIDVSKIFWDKDDRIKLLGITGIKSRAEMKVATMEYAGLVVQEVKVRNLEFVPINGRQLILKMQVQVHHTGDQLVKFDKLQMTTNSLRVYTSQDDLFTNDPG